MAVTCLTPSDRAISRNSSDSSSKRGLVVVHEVDLVDRQHELLDAHHGRNGGMAAGLFENAGAGIDQKDGKIGVEAPVAMLRVYCSWPGVSATMKERLLWRNSDRPRRW